MTDSPPPFFTHPILNSPDEEPSQHHALTEDGQPLNEAPRQGRRRSEFITPVPKPRKRKRQSANDQANLDLQSSDGISSVEQEYNPTPIINEIRKAVADWRSLPNPADWSVSPTTA